MDYLIYIKEYKKKLIESGNPVTLHRNDLKKVLPHREPFLFLENITSVDYRKGLISSIMTINPADPVFQGHFPGQPVYPGIYQLELIGQLFSCLYYFVKNRIDSIGDYPSVNLRATRIHHAFFQQGIFPGDTIEIRDQVIEMDDYKFIGVGQIVKNGRVAVVVVGEFFIV